MPNHTSSPAPHLRKRVLITGGAGYVGRTLTRLLYDQHDVCVVDVLNFGLDRFHRTELQRFRLERVDICDAHAVRAVVDDFQPDVLVHLAAIHFIPQCELSPGEAAATNIVGTANLLAACPQDCRFVFASSGAVYNPSQELHDERRSEIGPRDIYGYTKLHGEHYVSYFATHRRLATVVVRLFNVIGPGETNPHLLPELVAQIKAGYQRVRLGSLWPKRDYIHVRDAASGFAAAALVGAVAPGETVTVNLGTSRQYSVEEIVERMRAVCGLHFAVEQDPGRVRPVDRPFLGAAIGEIQRRFGWVPRYQIDDAMADLWRDPDLSAPLIEKYKLQAANG